MCSTLFGVLSRFSGVYSALRTINLMPELIPRQPVWLVIMSTQQNLIRMGIHCMRHTGVAEEGPRGHRDSTRSSAATIVSHVPLLRVVVCDEVEEASYNLR
jgi:hypothetical protein